MMYLQILLKHILKPDIFLAVAIKLFLPTLKSRSESYIILLALTQLLFPLYAARNLILNMGNT
jgi:hypothetical protein